MDFLRLITQHKCGLITAEQYENKLKHEFRKRMYTRFSFDVSKEKFSCQASDFSFYKNRLLIANKNRTIALYDVGKPVSDGFRCLQAWTIYNMYPSGLESINWSCYGDYFTISANDKHLYVMDLKHTNPIEKIAIKVARSIVQHKPNPHDTGKVAVASLSPKVVLLELKSGNIICTSSYHPRGVMAVSWSGIDEHFLVSAGDDGTCFWDIRKFRRPMYVNRDNCIFSGILPNFEMIPHTDKLILLNIDRDITIWDVRKLHKDAHFGPFIMPFEKRVRYKLATTGPLEPGLLFMPADHDIRVYDFKTMEKIGELHGHFSPVQVLYYNNYTDQLYSSAADGSLVWVPRRPNLNF